MKKTNLLLGVLMTAGLLSAAEVQAQNALPDYGSLAVKGAKLYSGTLPVEDNLNQEATETLDYKVVSMNGKTHVFMQVSAGTIWGDVPSEFGYTTDDGATVIKFSIPAGNRISNTQTTGFTTEAIPENAKIFMRPQVNIPGGHNGAHHTQPVTYNPNACNGADANDHTAPVFPEGFPKKTTTAGSITIELGATDESETLFYYIVDRTSKTEDIVFTHTVSYDFPPTENNHTWHIYAVDFSGNVSDVQVVSVIDEDARPLPAPENLQISDDKKSLSFDEVEHAAGYFLQVCENDEEQEVVYQMENYRSGDELKYLLAGEYIIKVRANGDGNEYAHSELAVTEWIVEETDIDLSVNAQYDNYLFDPPAGNNGIAGDQDAAYLTWNTEYRKEAAGDIIITIAPHFMVEEVSQTEFRNNGINSPENITVNGVANTDNQFFTLSTEKDENGLNTTVRLTPAKHIPVGSHVCYSTGFMVYKTVANAETNTSLGLGGALHDLYPNTPYTDEMPFIYGTNAVFNDDPTTLVGDPTQSDMRLVATIIDNAELRFSEEAAAIRLFTLQGQLALSAQRASSLNVAGLAKGMYIVKALDEAGKPMTAKIEIR